MKLGIIARSDNTGLGNQTRELVNMLNPKKILLINSTPFNKNKQHPEWYAGYDVITTSGFANNNEVALFLRGLDVVISCEIFYHPQFVELARKAGVKTILQYNYEFLDYLVKPNVMLPDILLAPSTWHLEEVNALLGDKTKVVLLPPPTDHSPFMKNLKTNYSKSHKKILHIAGRRAVKDRNGTETVLEMMRHSKGDYELVIKIQGDPDFTHSDSRITIDNSETPNRENLYCGYDAMVLPRRYAGLCLPMNEALLSGLPVFMTDISPNNRILPPQWLAESKVVDTLQTRTLLDVYEADPAGLASLVDDYMADPYQLSQKKMAFSLGFKNFSPDYLEERYLEILK